MLATAGGLVVYGTMDGQLKAVDAKTGRLVWNAQLPSGIIGQPITYRGPDGKQYIAVYSGVGGWAGSIVSLGLDPRDLSAGNGWGNVGTFVIITIVGLGLGTIRYVTKRLPPGMFTHAGYNAVILTLALVAK